MVVNGAQSLTSLLNSKSAISQDLKVLVKVVELGVDAALSDKITTNSNNQNAIKARDLKSNNPIQERLKKEVWRFTNGKTSYEVKRGEKASVQSVISNENAGLALLSMDVGEPWSCHQRYKVMDESHAKIFGRPEVDGAKIVILDRCLKSIEPTLDEFDDAAFGHYTLTRYFFICGGGNNKERSIRKKTVLRLGKVSSQESDSFLSMFKQLPPLPSTTLMPRSKSLSRMIIFDYKRDLKSPTWCRTVCSK